MIMKSFRAWQKARAKQRLKKILLMRRYRRMQRYLDQQRYKRHEALMEEIRKKYGNCNCGGNGWTSYGEF